MYSINITFNSFFSMFLMFLSETWRYDNDIQIFVKSPKINFYRKIYVNVQYLL